MIRTELFLPALTDLVDTCPVPASVQDEPWSDDGPSFLLLAPDSTGQGVWTDLSLPEPERLVHVAEQLQEWAVEALWASGSAEVWPVCPEHPDRHPLRPMVLAGRAVWACPGLQWGDEHAVAAIGELASPR